MASYVSFSDGIWDFFEILILVNPILHSGLIGY